MNINKNFIPLILNKTKDIEIGKDKATKDEKHCFSVGDKQGFYKINNNIFFLMELCEIAEKTFLDFKEKLSYYEIDKETWKWIEENKNDFIDESGWFCCRVYQWKKLDNFKEIITI